MLPLVVLACEELPRPADAGIAASEDLCRLQAAVPLSPRVVVAPLYGEPRVLERAVCAACFDGQPGAWAAGDRELIEVHFGDQLLELPNEPASALHLTHALHGVTLGRGVALVDLGDHWLVWQRGRAPRAVPPPLLEPGDTVWGVGGELRLHLLVRRDLPPRVRRVPLEGAELDDVTVTTLDDRPAGRLERAEQGAVLLLGSERRVPLGDTRAIIGATVVADTVVAWAPRETVLAVAGVVERVRGRDMVLVDDEEVVVVEAAPRRVRRVVGGAWSTVLQARPGADLAGVPLADGAQTIRLDAALAHGHLALVERVRAADCGVIDTVHIVELATGGLRTVARDAHLRMHIAPVDDGFGWVEAEVGRIEP